MRGSSAQIECGLSFRILTSNLSCVRDSNPSNNLSKSWVFSGLPFRSRHCHAFSAISVASDNKIGLANAFPIKRNESCCGDSDSFLSNSFATRCNDFAFQIIESASQFSTSFLFSATKCSPYMPLVGKLLEYQQNCITTIYAHLADEHLVEAVEKVGIIIAEAKNYSDQYRSQAIRSASRSSLS